MVHLVRSEVQLMHEVWVTAIAEPLNLKEFSFSPKGQFVGIASTKPWGAAAPEGPFTRWLRKRRVSLRATNTAGKADPIWDTKFSPKLGRDRNGDIKKEIVEKAVVPKGRIEAFDAFLKRAASLTPDQEIEWINATCHQEIATTMEEFRANSIAGRSLDELGDGMENNISESDSFDGITFSPSPLHIAAMSRRIEWEKTIVLSGKTERCWWALTKSGTVGIEYRGEERSSLKVIEIKRAFKYNWIDRFGAMPTVEDILAGQKLLRDTHNLPALSMLTPEQAKELDMSKKGMLEDYDLYRAKHHADPDPKPNFAEYDDDEVEEYREELAAWQDRETKRSIANNRPDGYAGPSGLLGLDENHPENNG